MWAKTSPKHTIEALSSSSERTPTNITTKHALVASFIPLRVFSVCIVELAMFQLRRNVRSQPDLFVFFFFWKQELFLKRFVCLLSENQRATFAGSMASAWLSLRLQVTVTVSCNLI